MNIYSGVDLIEISRIAESIENFNNRFLNKIYTTEEQEICKKNIPSLAARFAAKEAVSKALKTGIGLIQWTDIEILKDQTGAPTLYLHNNAKIKADELNIKNWSISLSHSKKHAIAMVTALAH